MSSNAFGGFKFSQNDLKEIANKKTPDEITQESKAKIENIFNLVSPQFEIIQKTKPNIVSVIQEVVQQLSKLKFLKDIEENNNFSFDFEENLNFNPVFMIIV